MKFKSKIVVISGGGAGIGLATAERFVSEGAHVIITGRNEKRLLEAQKKLGQENVDTFIMDVTNVKDIRKLKIWLNQKYEEVDILFCNAGVARFNKIEDVGEDEYDLVMNTNAKGAFFLASILSPIIRNHGSIIFNGSYISSKSIPLTAVLAASKVTVESFVKTFAIELALRNIRVNAVRPGSIKTDFMFNSKPDKKQIELLGQALPDIPLGKRGVTESIADGVLFLASDEASYITGSILDIDGGLSLV